MRCCNRLNALDITSGKHREGSPSAPVAGERTFPSSDFPNNATIFRAIKQLQRPGAATSHHLCRDLCNTGHHGLFWGAFFAALGLICTAAQCQGRILHLPGMQA